MGHRLDYVFSTSKVLVLGVKNCILAFTRGGGVLYIFWVRGRAIGKGIDFHDFGIRNGIDFHEFGIRNGITFRDFHNWYWIRYPFSENWYKVGYIFSKNCYKVGYTRGYILEKLV